NTLTTGTVLGTRQPVVKAGTMTLASVKLNLGRVRKGKRGKGSVVVAGTIEGVPANADPSAGTTVQIAVPGNGAMVIVARDLQMNGHGKRFVGRSTSGDGGGTVTLKLKRRGEGSFRFVLAGKGMDLAALDTGTSDLTVAIETSGAQFVQNRNLASKKGVYRL